VVNALGWTINTMTLGGLAVALGVVVDDAIIDVENIIRRLRKHRTNGDRAASEETPGRAIPSGSGDDRPREIIHAASLEVRAPVVYATFVVVLVLAPMLFLSGLQGSFFAPLAASFIFATLASLGVALTVTPAASLLLLTRAGQHGEPAWLAWLKTVHRKVLQSWMPHPRVVLAGSLAVMLLASAALPFFGGELMPPFREGHFAVQAVATPGTSLQAMKDLGRQVSHDLLTIPGVAWVEETI